MLRTKLRITVSLIFIKNGSRGKNNTSYLLLLAPGSLGSSKLCKKCFFEYSFYIKQYALALSYFFFRVHIFQFPWLSFVSFHSSQI